MHNKNAFKGQQYKNEKQYPNSNLKSKEFDVEMSLKMIL
jgi:hypothetical protein